MGWACSSGMGHEGFPMVLYDGEKCMSHTESTMLFAGLLAKVCQGVCFRAQNLNSQHCVLPILIGNLGVAPQYHCTALKYTIHAIPAIAAAQARSQLFCMLQYALLVSHTCFSKVCFIYALSCHLPLGGQLSVPRAANIIQCPAEHLSCCTASAKQRTLC